MSQLATATYDQKMSIVYLLNDLLTNQTIRDGIINSLIKLIISEAIYLEKYDFIKRLFDNGLI